jgi:hypothetical protein
MIRGYLSPKREEKSFRIEEEDAGGFFFFRVMLSQIIGSLTL